MYIYKFLLFIVTTLEGLNFMFNFTSMSVRPTVGGLTSRPIILKVDFGLNWPTLVVHDKNLTYFR